MNNQLTSYALEYEGVHLTSIESRFSLTESQVRQAALAAFDTSVHNTILSVDTQRNRLAQAKVIPNE